MRRSAPASPEAHFGKFSGADRNSYASSAARLIAMLRRWVSRFMVLSVDDVEDVAVRILEPGGFHAGGDGGVAFGRAAREVVVLEGDPLRLERALDRFELGADVPGHRRGLVAAGVLRLVDQQRRGTAAVGDQVPALAADRRQA